MKPQENGSFPLSPQYSPSFNDRWGMLKQGRKKEPTKGAFNQILFLWSFSRICGSFSDVDSSLHLQK